MARNYNLFILIIIGMILIIPNYTRATDVEENLLYPEETWLQYTNPEDAGFSAEKLDEIKLYSEMAGLDALMIVYDGAVVAAWGDIERRYLCHSVRKSFLSALYGVYVDKEIIDLDKSLGELGVTEGGTLTEQEETAKIIDLLEARSGIYHPAAAETDTMKLYRPERGSHMPGTYWYYNNWDFNALGSIFEQETGKKIFKNFEEMIAIPLKMQDYRVMDGYYYYEKDYSIYPAYHFKMSARDMARFGLLYLRNGKWKDQQIISRHWVNDSIQSYSEADHIYFDGYGYMWWVNNDKGVYAALGSGEQIIAIIPDEKIVFVHLTNTYENKSISPFFLIDWIMEAKVEEPEPNPNLISMPLITDNNESKDIDKDFLSRYLGSYQLPDETVVKIYKRGEQMVIQIWSVDFSLIPYEEGKLYIEDLDGYLQFEDNGIRITYNNESILARKIK